LRCAAGYLEEDCGEITAPYKGWVDDAGGVRETRCAWTGCVVATSNSCPAETPKESEVVECETAPGGEPVVNIKCCAEEPEWECCGVLECVANDYSPPPPPPPPASSPPPPLSPSSPPPSPFTWGWSLVGSDVDGEAAFEAFGDAVAVSLDGTRVAVGSPSADDDEIGANVGRVRVYERGPHARGCWFHERIRRRRVAV
jgi:hypothetical protein